MAIWLIRAGSHGEYEQKFIQENRAYVTWDDLDVNLAKLKQRADLTAAMTERYPDTKPKAIRQVSSGCVYGRKRNCWNNSSPTMTIWTKT